MKLVEGMEFGNGEQIGEQDIALIEKYNIPTDGRDVGTAVYEAVKTSYLQEIVKPLVARFVEASMKNNGDKAEAVVREMLLTLEEVRKELDADPSKNTRSTAKFHALTSNFFVAENDYYAIRLNQEWYPADRFGFFSLAGHGASTAESLFAI